MFSICLVGWTLNSQINMKKGFIVQGNEKLKVKWKLKVRTVKASLPTQSRDQNLYVPYDTSLIKPEFELGCVGGTSALSFGIYNDRVEGNEPQARNPSTGS